MSIKILAEKLEESEYLGYSEKIFSESNSNF
jgi:hypothetical protein